jgi:cell pole-organizing protein PopZ
MANPSAAHEPSMEEILASIRQIISEDGEPSEQPRPGQNAPTDAAPEPEASSSPAESPRSDAAAAVAVPSTQGERMKSQSSGRAVKASAEPSATMSVSGPAHYQETTPKPAARTELAPRSGRGDEDRLLSDHSDTAVSGAFSALAHTILAQNARTLEDLVSEMLRPMLKDWLDDNLPSLVERLVQEEIQRVSRGRR